MPRRRSERVYPFHIGRTGRVMESAAACLRGFQTPVPVGRGKRVEKLNVLWRRQ
jgi:hypothetical protein